MHVDTMFHSVNEDDKLNLVIDSFDNISDFISKILSSVSRILNSSKTVKDQDWI